jgi:hypothetical protein
MFKDVRGHALSGATATSLPHFETAVRELNLFINDPIATVDKAIAESPEFVMAHALKAWLLLLGTEPAAVPLARAALVTASRLPATAQEKGHLAAIEQLVEGRWRAASRLLEDVAIEHPRDLLALQVGHQIDFFRGDARMLRDRIARARPAWSPDVPGYHVVLGMHAFGLEETGEYAEAERLGRRAVGLEVRDAWAQHAVAHVMEMQGRHSDGIAWMAANSIGWAHDSFLAVHNWWHVALYHLDLGEIDEVLTLFDGPIYGSRSGLVLDLVDASALLWRLRLRGIDVGNRWRAVADAWQPVAEAGLYAFNDVHAVMAFIGAGRNDWVERVLDAQLAATNEDGDNALFTQEVGHSVARALKAFGRENYAECIRLLRDVRNIACRFGGSHAQRDVIDLTLIEAALRSGHPAMARALAAERHAIRPKSPLARLLVNRAAELQRAA